MTCACGSEIKKPKSGPVAARCPACQKKAAQFQNAMSILRGLMADPTFKAPERQRHGEVLMEMGKRLRRDGDVAVLADALDVIDALGGRVDVDEPEKVSRRLNAARERIAYRAGLRR